jgi:hypothetical protein
MYLEILQIWVLILCPVTQELGNCKWACPQFYSTIIIWIELGNSATSKLGDQP